MIKKDFNALEERRLAAVEMQNNDIKPIDIAASLNVSRQAVSVWLKKYKTIGKKGLLKRKATGRPAKFNMIVFSKELPQILKKGAVEFGYTTDMWTTANISEVVWRKFGIKYHRDHIRKLLHKLGFSCQKPQKRAIERDDRIINNWVKTTWPYVKKNDKKPRNTCVC
ncbi:MAG TPA: hypothetical protein DD725_06275 [Deltaproteobacteria bacterium]|nr:hypothetical protein [Deltaproteobacteria bacterium]